MATIAQKLALLGGNVDASGEIRIRADGVINGRVINGNVIDINMDKARDIVRNRLRAEREPLMAKLDADWFRAAETNDGTAQASITTKKQELRDITFHPSIDSATTAEELSLVTLDTLLE